MKPMFGRSSATGNGHRKVRVLFDGWPLAFAPASPPALHLWELLAALPDEVEPLVALPADTPNLAAFERIIYPAASTVWSRFRWEQVTLPLLIRRCRTDLLHMTVPYPPLLCPVPCVVSPAELLPRDFSLAGAGQRLRFAFGRGGLSQGTRVLWPEDLSLPDWTGRVDRLPPYVHPLFSTPHSGDLLGNTLQLPESFVFCPGPVNSSRLADILSAWSWAAAGLGDDWSLLFGGLSPKAEGQLEELRALAGITGPVKSFSYSKIEDYAPLYHQAGAVFHFGSPVPWGDSLLHALAAGVAVAAEDNPQVDARVGPAAYLAPVGDARTLGAAVLTLIVEESVAEPIKQAALERAAHWGMQGFAERLSQIYLLAKG